jgi:hypothetical protein
MTLCRKTSTRGEPHPALDGLMELRVLAVDGQEITTEVVNGGLLPPTRASTCRA